MALAFTTAGMTGAMDGAQILVRAQALDLRLVHIAAPLVRPASSAATLRSAGVQVCSLSVAEPADARTFPAALEAAAAQAATLRAGVVLVEAGATGADREAATERLARMLHGPVRAGVPLAVRNGAQESDLLGHEELGWLTSELPRLGFWFDPWAAWRQSEQGSGLALQTWVDTWAGRIGGVFVQGGPADSEGHSHPTDGGPDWGSLVAALPQRLPWVLDLGPRLTLSDVADAARWLRSLRS